MIYFGACINPLHQDLSLYVCMETENNMGDEQLPLTRNRFFFHLFNTVSELFFLFNIYSVSIFMPLHQKIGAYCFTSVCLCFFLFVCCLCLKLNVKTVKLSKNSRFAGAWCFTNTSWVFLVFFY